MSRRASGGEPTGTPARSPVEKASLGGAHSSKAMAVHSRKAVHQKDEARRAVVLVRAIVQ